MTPIIASNFGWEFDFLLYWWPTLNWLGALVVTIGSFRKSSSARWLWPATVPVGSAAWLASNFIRFEGGVIEAFHIYRFFLPGLIGLGASVVVAWRVFRKPSTSRDVGRR